MNNYGDFTKDELEHLIEKKSHTVQNLNDEIENAEDSDEHENIRNARNIERAILYTAYEYYEKEYGEYKKDIGDLF